MSVPTLGPSAALAGVPSGIQAQGVWTGRRQLFVRFADEAETATMFTSAALAGELKRLSARSAYHSVSVSGRDALGNAEFLAKALEIWTPTLPVLLDGDGQRPEVIREIGKRFSMIQTTVDFSGPDASVERALETLAASRAVDRAHALVLSPTSETTDGQLLRLVARAHEISDSTILIVHPPVQGTDLADRRWQSVMEQGARAHADIRLVMRIPPPAGMR